MKSLKEDWLRITLFLVLFAAAVAFAMMAKSEGKVKPAPVVAVMDTVKAEPPTVVLDSFLFKPVMRYQDGWVKVIVAYSPDETTRKNLTP